MTNLTKLREEADIDLQKIALTRPTQSNGVTLMTFDLQILEYFIKQRCTKFYQAGQQDMLERDRGVVLSWKNEGDDPTETDLVLENILKALDNLTK
jgi:hypothetical protein